MHRHHSNLRKPLAAAVLLIGLGGLMSAAGPPSAGAQSPAYPYVPGEVLVTYRAGTGLAQASRVARGLGVPVLETLKRSGIQRVRVPAGQSVESTARAFAAQP